MSDLGGIPATLDESGEDGFAITDDYDIERIARRLVVAAEDTAGQCLKGRPQFRLVISDNFIR